MSMDNVRKLFKRLGEVPELRKKLYQADGQEGREAVLREEDLFFTDAEFDEMEGVLHAQCKTEDDADRFNEFKTWWDFLRRT